MSGSEHFARLGREFVHLLLPSPCVVCGRELPLREREGSCCRACWQALPRIAPPKCVRCALPWNTTATVDEFVCIECSTDPLPLDWIDAWGEYDSGLGKVLHAFKFEGHEFLGEPLSTLMLETLASRGDLEFDRIVPVPMHPARRRARGYNQAAILAEKLARATRIRKDERVLRKVTKGEAQARLPREARRANVKKAYEAKPGARDLAILLVDDICTTGETLRACALALRRAGARRVAAIVVARTR